MTFGTSEPKLRLPIIGLFGFVFTSTTGAKSQLIPILFASSAIFADISEIKLLSWIAPKVIAQGNLCAAAIL